MSTLNDLGLRTQDRLEEVRDGVGVFWSLQNEIFTALVEAANEAMLLTGEPQVRSTQATTLLTNSNLQPMPPGALAILRVEGVNSLPISKLFVCDLDRQYPAWENDAGYRAKAWFPVGLTQWGIYPQILVDQQVVITYVEIPVSAPLPYTGAEILPFQEEFCEGFIDYAAHICRLKETGSEFQESMAEYDRFLTKMQDMSTFAKRKDRLRFTKYGPVVTFTNTTEV